MEDTLTLPEEILLALADINPEAGEEDEDKEQGLARFPIEEDLLETEVVLIPAESVVVSSSRTGRILHIPVDNGDLVKKGDLLVEYACEDLKAEIDSLKERTALSQVKKKSAEKLFKLEIISNIDHVDLLSEHNQVMARLDVLKAQLKDCSIKAEFDARITNRLANPHEYTRTDRVLLEVASTEQLNAKLLIPSRWLRWVNVGAPITIEISETGKVHNAKISRIYGEVDPASQSIQIEAELEPYETRLLPGMSGLAKINAENIQSEGIIGYLEEPQKGR